MFSKFLKIGCVLGSGDPELNWSFYSETEKKDPFSSHHKVDSLFFVGRNQDIRTKKGGIVAGGFWRNLKGPSVGAGNASGSYSRL